MAHVPDGALRRLVDDPLAVPDAQSVHVAGCARCAARRSAAADDAHFAGSLFARPRLVPDVDRGWARWQEAAGTAPAPRHRPGLAARRGWRLVVVPLPAPRVLVASLLLLVAGGVALGLSSSSAPPASGPSTGTSPTATGGPDGLEALADVAGIGGNGVLGGLPAPTGTMSLPFGSLTWISSGPAKPVASIAVADAMTGLDVRLPTRLPPGVGAAETVVVQPVVAATVRFDASAGAGLAGRSLTVTAGPAVLVEYGGTDPHLDLPTLATVVMARPVATSGAGETARLEAFVLSRPGLPAGLVQEVRLVADVGTTLPVPAVAGVEVSQVDVDGVPGILVTDSADGLSGVIWEDRNDVHAALGLLDQEDILDVANQLG